MNSRSLNKVHIIGNLVQDPTLRDINDSARICTFQVATERIWKSEAGEEKQETALHNVIAWQKLAEICESILHKGDLVYIEGEIRYRDVGIDDTRRIKTEIKIDNMSLLKQKNDSNDLYPDVA